MILTVDLDLTPQVAQNSVLAKLLSKAKISSQTLPLEALISEQFSLPVQTDFPLGAICAHADGLEVGNQFWMRADPVHLVLQRDSFSLGEPVPLSVSLEHTQQLFADLNAHFKEDGFTFQSGKWGAWYLRWEDAPEMRTNLPTMVIGKDIHGFMPKGAYAGKWLAIVNEIQMLLFEHPINQLREADGLVAINSIWVSGGGVLPVAPQSAGTPLLAGDLPLYHGLAEWAGLKCHAPDITSIFENSTFDVRMALHTVSDLDTSFNKMYQALKERKVKAITFNIGFYNQCYVAIVQPMDLYKFWRRNKSLESLLA